jgi:hypothetical protein
LAGPRLVGDTAIIRDIVPADSKHGYYISVDEDPNVSDQGYGSSSIPAIPIHTSNSGTAIAKKYRLTPGTKVFAAISSANI